MKHKITQIFLFFLLISQGSCSQPYLELGAERTDLFLPILYNKSVGVVANQTSLIGDKHLVDTLLELEVNIIKIFSPEHGFRGEMDAGAAIIDGIDSITSLPIISLYGKNKKPTSENLKGIDVLIFDIQDVGARFYTYISTLHYVMEAAAENQIPLIVLDRPNPNGHYVDGPVLDISYRSFVGMHPIPVVHGMTIGEYAQMINGEGWLHASNKCKLHVIEMKNYNRLIEYHLPLKPSPNLPNSKAINLYPSLCFFEGTVVSVGRGTEFPFQQFGAPFLNYDYFFIPMSTSGAKYPKLEGQQCFGVDLRESQKLEVLNLSHLIKSYEECPDSIIFFNSFFDKLAGNSTLKQQIIDGLSEDEIRKGWTNDLEEFKKIREDYLIYN